MKIKDKTRTRLIGYFGLAVATLLTPGGKLISSAVAAATVAGLIGMNMATKQDQANQPVPAIHSGGLPTDEEILGAGNLTTADEASDTLSAETLIPEPNAALGNQTAFATQTMPAANMAAVNAVGVGGEANAGSALSTFDPKISAQHGPDPIKHDSDPIKRDPKECTVVILGELASNTEIMGDEITCLEKDTLASSEGNPESQTDSESPTVSRGVPESDVPETVVPKSPASYPEPVLLATPEYIGPDSKDVSPTQMPLVVAEQDQPFISIGAIPEPSTLGLFLMGLMGFVQVYRKNKTI